MPCPHEGGSQNRYRKSIRLTEYDYSRPGAYFITICAHNRANLFAEIREGIAGLNNLGCVLAQCWNDIPHHFKNVLLDECVIMPNHVHGILIFQNGRGTACRAPTKEKFGKPTPKSLPTIIRSFKSATTKIIREILNEKDRTVWQRGYFDHIIRDEASLLKIREYIKTNPLRWQLDKENNFRQGNDPLDECLNSFKKLETQHAYA